MVILGNVLNVVCVCMCEGEWSKACGSDTMCVDYITTTP